MTSKEALENLVHCKSITKCKECKHKNICTMERDYNIIKQDLERKEKLEKAIEILKQFISLDLECNIICEIRMGREMIVISQQEYELLKEVLE